jgi:ATP-dependent Clp protease ATP-binding subunit ClpC
MFERFTESARRAIMLAQEEARHLQHGYIGTEHLLLGLLREPGGSAARALSSFGLTVVPVRRRVAEIVGRGTAATGGQIPFTHRAKKALEGALRAAVSRGEEVDTEHILLGLLSVDGGPAAEILRAADVSADAVHAFVDQHGEGGAGALREQLADVELRLAAAERSSEVMAAIAGAERLDLAFARLRELLGIDDWAVRTVLAMSLEDFLPVACSALENERDALRRRLDDLS